MTCLYVIFIVEEISDGSTSLKKFWITLSWAEAIDQNRMSDRVKSVLVIVFYL